MMGYTAIRRVIGGTHFDALLCMGAEDIPRAVATFNAGTQELTLGAALPCDREALKAFITSRMPADGMIVSRRHIRYMRVMADSLPFKREYVVRARGKLAKHVIVIEAYP